jgi:site-specific recombinase XerD
VKDSVGHLVPDGRSRGNPLVLHIAPFAASLIEDGYVHSTIDSKTSLLVSLGRWLARGKFTLTDLDEQLIDRFITGRRRSGRLRRGDGETVRQFLDHLRRLGTIPLPTPIPDESPSADVLNRYERHLRSERGLTTATVVNYVPFVRKFLAACFRHRPLHFQELRSADISAFVLRTAHTMSFKRAQTMTTAFRSFFRFLFQNGELQCDLAAAVPTVADWRLASVPKYLLPAEIDRVLDSCDRRTSTGRRDYAILLLLARLGLRGGEVVSLQLDDIAWRTGEILVRGKGLLHDLMPLPVDVGEALTAYLRRDRPVCKTRRVFICMKAPRSGFTGPSTVSTIVRRALDRAGLHPALKGAHVMRHSLATSMLRSGASMGEIGEVLRHRVPGTTEIYAKLDFEGLRSLAHPWPGVGRKR